MADYTRPAVKDELNAFKQAWSSKVADLVQRAAEVGAQDKAAAAELWLTVAEIQLVYGEQPDAALGSLDKAVAGKPGHQGALRLMEEIYGSQDRYEDLALKLEMMAAYARDPAVAVDLYLKAAMHNAVRLDSPDAAARLYVRVLETDPGNKVASNALAEYYRERKPGRPPEHHGASRPAASESATPDLAAAEPADPPRRRRSNATPAQITAIPHAKNAPDF